MREIVQVQLGQCGNNIGMQFWELLLKEHGLNLEGRFRGQHFLQLQRINVFFTEGSDGKYVPRAVLGDSDSANLLSAISRYRGLFKPDSIVYRTAKAGNNWAKGYYNEGAELANLILELVRTEVEACDLLQGIQIVHSLSGGTGSGTGSLLAVNINEEYPNKILNSYAEIPSLDRKIIVEPYNAVLSLRYLTDYAHEVFCVNNMALNRVCTQVLRLLPIYGNTNCLVAACMSDITSSLRFPGQLNSDLRKLLVNLVPFPHLHFFVLTHVPLVSAELAAYENISVRYLTRQMFSPTSMFVDCNPRDGQYLTVAVIFRGDISSKHVAEDMRAVQRKNRSNFLEWIPHNIKVTICDVAHGPKKCAALLANTTAIRQPFQKLYNRFQDMFRSKAYTHWYLNEGMEETEFSEAGNKLQSLIDDYEHC